MGDLSAHFSRWEFRDKHNGQEHPIDPELLRVLECIRAKAGRPVRIVSGYRSPATNQKVGGARRSQHLYGRAADIEPGLVTVAEARRCGAVGIGSRGGWAVHVDVRRGRPASWRYD